MTRSAIFLAAAFALSWGCWWILGEQVSPDGGLAASRVSRALYLFGGLGPAIAAGLAVALTPVDGRLVEFIDRLSRWRVSWAWWLAALVVPAAIAAAREGLAIWLGAGTVHAANLAPLSRAPPLFFAMILGGGLEELGWRGVLQAEIARRAPPLTAALIVGAVWAAWHLPLFHLSGAPQYGRYFPLFAFDVLANACLLAWIYAGTRSVLLCVVFHAASNAATAMGLVAIGAPTGGPAWIATGVKLALAVALLAFAPRRRVDQAAGV